jgi:hypothetical protein
MTAVSPWFEKAHRHRSGHPAHKPANARLRPERQRHFHQLPARLDRASDVQIRPSPFEKRFGPECWRQTRPQADLFLILAPPAA